MQASPLNSVLAGEETAVSLGLNIHRFRVRILVVTSLLIGVMVAVSGAMAIVSLLLRFFEPQGGRILVDGRDGRQLALAELRDLVGVVAQDTYSSTARSATTCC